MKGECLASSVINIIITETGERLAVTRTPSLHEDQIDQQQYELNSGRRVTECRMRRTYADEFLVPTGIYCAACKTHLVVVPKR